MNKYFFTLLFPLYALAQAPAYYNTIDFSKTGNDLKTQLATLVKNTHTNELVYTPEVWNALKQADLDPENPGNVFLIYGYNDEDTDTDNDRTRDKDASCHSNTCNGLWVREHIFPRSLGTPNLEFEGAGSDAHHLRSIDYNMNNDRGNKKYADGTGNAHTIGSNFYPGDEWKGDIARMIMYMYLRYPTQCSALAVGTGNATYSNEIPNIFLEWNEEDPVSQYEKNRNTVLQQMQGNRNPFIDNPRLATRIWNGPQAEDTWGNLSSVAYQLQNLKVYPTLTSGMVTVENDADDLITYTVYNNIGQVMNVQYDDNTVDFSSQASGIYFLSISNGAETKTFRIVKQ